MNEIKAPCDQCAFLGLHPWDGPGKGDCAFEVWKGALSAARIPVTCPKRPNLNRFPAIEYGSIPRYIDRSRINGGSHPRGRAAKVIARATA